MFYVCKHICICAFMIVYNHECMYVCRYVSMYDIVCIYVWLISICMHIKAMVFRFGLGGKYCHKNALNYNYWQPSWVSGRFLLQSKNWAASVSSECNCEKLMWAWATCQCDSIPNCVYSPLEIRERSPRRNGNCRRREWVRDIGELFLVGIWRSILFAIIYDDIP